MLRTFTRALLKCSMWLKGSSSTKESDTHRGRHFMPKPGRSMVRTAPRAGAQSLCLGAIKPRRPMRTWTISRSTKFVGSRNPSEVRTREVLLRDVAMLTRANPLRRLKARKLLIFQSAGDATTASIAQAGYTSGPLSNLAVLFLAGVASAEEVAPRFTKATCSSSNRAGACTMIGWAVCARGSPRIPSPAPGRQHRRRDPGTDRGASCGRANGSRFARAHPDSFVVC